MDYQKITYPKGRKAMKTFAVDTGYVVRLDLNEEVIETLTNFVEKEGLAGGTISGIGALKDVTLGYFDPERKEYIKKTFPKEMELVQLTANITHVDGKPFIHAHAIVSGADYIARAGHLFSATIAITGEMFVLPTDTRIKRSLDPVTGAKLMV